MRLRFGLSVVVLSVGIALTSAPAAAAPCATLGCLWQAPVAQDTTSLAWGDVDLDGWLDLVFGTGPGLPLELYRNVDGDLVMHWTSTELDDTRGVAWADVDRDGDLDLAVANGGPNRLYRNDAGTLILAWTSTETNDSTDVAWADVDGDGDLDLAVANRSAQPVQLYRNDAGSLVLHWTSAEVGDAEVLAWGYLDGDRMPDLAVGFNGQPNRVYRAAGGALSLAWTAPVARTTVDIAWMDIWGGDELDLVFANDAQGYQLYENRSGALHPMGEQATPEPVRCMPVPEKGGDPSRLLDHWQESPETIRACAYGDLDHDGDLDLAVARDARLPSAIFAELWLLHNGWWASVTAGGGSAVAFADWDCDGDLDLAVAGWASPIGGGTQPYPKQIYENEGGDINLTLTWQSPDRTRASGLAWGDWDGDGDLDLAVSNRFVGSQVYENDGGAGMTLAWTDPTGEAATDLAWADVDGDNDLDLALGTTSPSVYSNDGARGLSRTWVSPTPPGPYRIQLAWGDFDRDGDPDLAVGGTLVEVYRNDGGNLVPLWTASESYAGDIAWGDMDGDGAPDLVLARNTELVIYRCLGSSFALTWRGADPAVARYYALALADWDDDGDLDVAAATEHGHCLYRNTGGTLVNVSDLQNSLYWPYEAIAWADLNDDGDLELALTTRNDHGSTVWVTRPTQPRPRAGVVETAGFPVIHSRPGRTQNGFFQSSAERLGSPVLIPYNLVDREGDSVTRLVAEYSPTGGGYWLPATMAPGGDGIYDLEASPGGTPHVFAWDAVADAVVSDFTTFRIGVPHVPTRIGHPITHATQFATSAPFRVGHPAGTPVPEPLVVLTSVAPDRDARPGTTVTFTIEVRNVATVEVVGVDVASEVDDPNLRDPAALSNLVCPPPGIGLIDRSGSHPVVRCTGLDVPAQGAAFVTFEAVIADPYERAPWSLPDTDRVCVAATASHGGGCRTSPPACAGIAFPNYASPDFSKRAERWDDIDLDGELGPGDGLWFRIEMCHPKNSDAQPWDVLLRDRLENTTTGTYDSLTSSRGAPVDLGDGFEITGVVLTADSDPALACLVVDFRTFVGSVSSGTAVCNVSYAEWLDKDRMLVFGRYSNWDDPAAPTACFTTTAGCLSATLAETRSLTVVKEPGGARLRWIDDSTVARYHVNSVQVKTDLLGDGPHRPARGGAVAQCDVTDRSASCLDGDAWSDGIDLLFYRVMAACGADGLDEGPP